MSQIDDDYLETRHEGKKMEVLCHRCGTWQKMTQDQWMGREEISCRKCGRVIQPKKETRPEQRKHGKTEALDSPEVGG
jgi:uncharacterized OB-fold protein